MKLKTVCVMCWILQTLQGEVRAKELEMDTATERAQQLHKGSSRNTQVAELAQKYQQLSTKVKVRWIDTVSYKKNTRYSNISSAITARYCALPNVMISLRRQPTRCAQAK